jgi:hypothetical protein
LITQYNWSIQEIENLIPWEREVYMTILISNEEKKKQSLAEKQMAKEFRI